jgi:hypothetical protein
MKKTVIVRILFAVCLLFTACSEFIEPAITGRKVMLLAPADKHESNSYTQNFWWEPVEDALNYRLQIVTPSFDSIGSMLTDTLINTNKFVYSLSPGKYEWRVRAQNGSSQTLYTRGTFLIHLSSIAIQQTQVLAPANNTTTGADDITYKWAGMFSATRYRFQLDTNSFANDSVLVSNTTTPALSLTVPFESERTYQWRVRAENDTSASRWSVIQHIRYDKTPPAKVTLNEPANNTVVTKPISLNWNNVAGAKRYELFIYKSDGTTVYNSSYPVSLAVTSHLFNSGDLNEVIFWKVRAIDEAGNKGAFSELRSFSIR